METFLADRARILREFVDCEKDADAKRRHEQRLVQVAQAIRQAMSEQPDLFSNDADVPAAAEAAVRILERE